MTVDDAIRELMTVQPATLPREAMRCLLDHWDEAASGLISMVDRYATGTDRTLANEQAVFFAVHLLGERSETSAFPAICRLLGDGAATEQVLGDAITETLSRILISIYDGDLPALQAIVEDTETDDFVRCAALDALSYLARIGRVDGSGMRAYLLHLLAEMQPQADHPVWTSWVLAVANLGYEDLAPQAEKLMRRGFVPRIFMRVSDFRDDLRRTLDDPERMAGFEHDRLRPLSGIIDELAEWHGFSEKHRRELAKPTPKLPRYQAPQTVTNHHRGLGRNDPCACGSGKKYKKCCLPEIAAQASSLSSVLSSPFPS